LWIKYFSSGFAFHYLLLENFGMTVLHYLYEAGHAKKKRSSFLLQMRQESRYRPSGIKTFW